MESNKLLFTVCLMFTFYSCYSQKAHLYTGNEVRCINVFNGFTNYLKTSIKNKTDITDSSELKYILVKYLFVDKKLDTTDIKHFKVNELSNDQLNNLKGQLNTFYNFLQEREDKALIENLSIMPLRLSRDTFIYNRLTPFQKENTYIFYDKRYPNQTLSYILFIPPINNLIAKPRIWSWTLMFKFGKFLFKSVTGEEGNEYLFSTDHK